MAQLRVGIVGAAGYTGAELIRLIDAHPELRLEFVAARENAGQRLGQVLPFTEGAAGLGELPLEAFDESQAAEVARRVDVAFTALPHAASARLGGALLDQGVQVVDLSADFRLRELETYQQWYGEHPRPELLERAVYGLPELYRKELEGARLIAGPGCYPTSTILPLAPLFRAGLLETDTPLIVDGKSGVSGAGRKPGPKFHFPETAEGLRPYNVGGGHRHTPEMEQELSVAAGGAPLRVLFTPQLVPMIRGILTTTYSRPKAGVTVEQCRQAARDLYGTGGLVTVLDDKVLPDTLNVRGSARAQLAYALDPRTGLLLTMSAIDNLARGASAQALQAFNVSRGFAETAGIPRLAMFP
ncbi:MAG TPA: N-acetyl-gamma-glutamyl-phosphate reductase [Polyangiaceae bacterium]|nr:N-acetyl-gamma-glutamyl-phosphate reductase [Polyangiaceae bacterium]